MKHIFIGDLHGRDSWREINGREFDKIIFVGDYVDSFDLSDLAILENFRKVIAFKQRHPDKVVLLLGNHDIQYLHYPAHTCSGFRETMQRGLTYLYNKHRSLFQIAYQQDNLICTHAGITNAWFNELKRLPSASDFDGNIAELLNHIDATTARYLLYATSLYRGGYSNGGPLWADRKETSTDMLDGYDQVVGHTQIQDITKVEYTGKAVAYIDVLHTQTKFLELNLNE